MRHHVFYSTCIVFFAVGASAAFAMDASSSLGQQLTSNLTKSGSVKEFTKRAEEPRLAPSNRLEELRAFVKRTQPDLLVEALYLIPKGMSHRGHSWSDGEKTALYDAIRAIHSLEGISYFSASRNKMRIFYERSTLIEGPENRNPVHDPVGGPMGTLEQRYAIQKDLTFGENVYRYEFGAAVDSIWFEQVNLTTMKYGIIPLVGKEGLSTLVIVSDADDALILYAAVAAKVALVPGLEDKMKSSFSNRADALYTWFKKAADSILGD